MWNKKSSFGPLPPAIVDQAQHQFDEVFDFSSSQFWYSKHKTSLIDGVFWIWG